MCGIAGVVAIGGGRVPPGAGPAVRSALACMRHRGPDGIGVHASSRFVLGHARLAIVDIHGGAQPLVDRPTQSAIAYNGEVYGYRLLAEPLAKERPLATQSDTEVLLRHLVAHGEGGLSDVNGMYAFCASLPGQQTLLIARDPIGIKPLYYFVRDGFLAFASELRAMVTLLRAMGFQASLDRSAVADYLRYGWIAAPRSLVRGVSKLRPGEVVSVSASGELVHRQSRLPGGASVASETGTRPFLRAMRSAVRDQLVADVPVGLFLSGGVDSSMVLALASEVRGSIPTFSVGFEKLASQAALYDESAQARLVAKEFGADHHEIQLDVCDVVDRLDDIARSVDEPIADPAVIPLFFLSQLAANHVKVCMTGDGGDELFGGYRHHGLREWRGWLDSHPSVHAALCNALGAVESSLFGFRLPRKAQVFASLALETRLVPELVRASHWPSELGAAQPIELPVPWSNPDALLHREIAGPLAAGMLHKTDRVTMFHSLEARVPLLDNRVIEMARSTPWNLKFRGLTSKWLMRQSLKEVSPRYHWGGRKRGFRVPLGQWVRADMGDWVHGRLARSSALSDLLGRQWLTDLLNSHAEGRMDHGGLLWALAVLQPWVDDLGPISEED